MAIRKTNNGYRVEVYLGIDPMTNKKIRKTKTFKKMKDAKDWEVKILQSYKDGELNISTNMTVREYLEYWYDTYVMANTKYNTQRRYRTLIDKIELMIGHIRLGKLKTPLIDRMYADMKLELNKDGTRRYSNTTIVKYHKVLVQALEKAIAWDLIVKNPAKYATKPQEDKTDIKTWDIKQVKYFLDEIRDSKIYQIYYPVLISFHTGLRQGEICALKWNDINLDEGYIDVRYNAVEKKGKGVVLETPKTSESVGKVALTQELIQELKELKKEQMIHQLKTGIESDFICSNNDSKGLRPTYISRSFKYHVERLEMPYMTFHGLRHTHASILYELGATSQEISKRLRHTRVSTTDDIYIHLKEDTKKSTADLFNQAVED